MKIFIWSLLFYLVSLPAYAAQSSFDYDFVDVRVGFADLGGASGAGILAGVSRKISPDTYAAAAYQYGWANDADYWQEDLYLGGGYILPLDNKTDINVGAGLLLQWVEGCAYYCGANNDTGIRLNAAYRHALDRQQELSAELIYNAIFDNADIGFSLTWILTQTEALSLGVQYESIGDLSITRVVARF
ncbi:MAG: hypothetical protein HUJ30_09420 [Gammaproteobacteria bacterium]|nr:hypothetical protein [Gammaproteobacteria bacterium]